MISRLFALLLILLSQHGIGQQSFDHDDYAVPVEGGRSEAADNEEDVVQIPFDRGVPIFDIPSAADPAPNNGSDNDTQQGNSQSENNGSGLSDPVLRTQERMALYTTGLFWVGVLGWLVAAATLWYLRETVKETQKMKRQDRAWVGISYNGRVNSAGEKEGFPLMFGFSVENTGKTPAIQHRSIIRGIRLPQKEFDPGPIINQMRSASPRYLPPGKVSNKIWEVTDDIRRDLQSSVSYGVYICCQYTTVYRETFLVEELFLTHVINDGGSIAINFRTEGHLSRARIVIDDNTCKEITADTI